VEVAQLFAALKAEHAVELVTFVALPGIQARMFGVGETITIGVHVGVGVVGAIGVDEGIKVQCAVGVGEGV
jgi:hypothetical protein